MKSLQPAGKYGQYHRPIARAILFWLNSGKLTLPPGLRHARDRDIRVIRYWEAK